ncbi:hypothetical protein ALQ45_02376, partial [Pseudomonas amygdali pv. morsprunorum]
QHELVTQSVTNCMPTRSIGTIVVSKCSSFPCSAWECLSGRSASNPECALAARACDAERHELHADAEHRHDSRLKMFIVPM